MALTPEQIKSSRKYSYQFDISGIHFYFDYGHGTDMSFSTFLDTYTPFDKNSIDEEYLIALNELKSKFKVNENSDFKAFRYNANSVTHAFTFHYSCLSNKNIVRTGAYIIPPAYDSYLLSFQDIFKINQDGAYSVLSTPHIYPYDSGSGIDGKYPKPLILYGEDKTTKLTNRFLFQYIDDSSFSYVTGEDGGQYLQTSKFVKYFAVSLIPPVLKCCIAEIFGITE